MDELPTIATPAGSFSRPPLRIPGTSTPGMTDDLLREASQRLQALSLVAISLWVVYFILGTWVIPGLHAPEPAAEPAAIADVSSR